VQQVSKAIRYSIQAGQLPVTMATTGRWHAGIHCEWPPWWLAHRITISHSSRSSFILIVVQFNVLNSQLNTIWLYFCSTLIPISRLLVGVANWTWRPIESSQSRSVSDREETCVCLNYIMFGQVVNRPIYLYIFSENQPSVFFLFSSYKRMR